MLQTVKRAREKQASQTQSAFEEFCIKNGIDCVALERNRDKRIDFLKDSNGKCPDYFCEKDKQSIFIEVKTHILITNAARELSMEREFKAAGDTGSKIHIIAPAYDPIPELRVPFENYLRDASRKFKNIKDDYSFPRILFLSGFNVGYYEIKAVFRGLYDGISIPSNTPVLVQQHRGILESTGSNVSAIVCWDSEEKRYFCVVNPKALIMFSKDDFNRFFA